MQEKEPGIARKVERWPGERRASGLQNLQTVFVDGSAENYNKSSSRVCPCIANLMPSPRLPMRVLRIGVVSNTCYTRCCTGQHRS